jgi:molecular chaperone GrpE
MSDNVENLHEEQVSVCNENSNQLQMQIAECQTALEEWKEKYLRVNADFDNFRKRTAKDQALWRQTAQIEVILPLLSIVDDFDRALEGQQGELTQKGLEGFVLIHKALNKYLQSLGVEVMTDYETFNPEYHEAIMQVDAPGYESGNIVAVLEKGYLFKGIVLRPAKVSVAK